MSKLLNASQNSQIITANAFLSGDVVYLGADESWVNAPQDALVLQNEGVATSALDFANALPRYVVGAYLIPVGLDGSERPLPLHLRERIRASGPTNYWLGKQTEAGFHKIAGQDIAK